MNATRTRIAFALMVVVLLWTHVFPLWPEASDPTGDLLGGWIPPELTYRLGWMVAAMAVVLFMTERVWRDEEDGPA